MQLVGVLSEKNLEIQILGPNIFSSRIADDKSPRTSYIPCHTEMSDPFPNLFARILSMPAQRS